MVPKPVHWLQKLPGCSTEDTKFDGSIWFVQIEFDASVFFHLPQNKLFYL